MVEKWGKKMKKKVNKIEDVIVSIDFNPIEIGFIQASIDIYLAKAIEKFGDSDDSINLPLIALTGKTCLGKFDKAVEKLDSLYEVGE